MSVYVYVCVYIYIYIYTYIHTDKSPGSQGLQRKRNVEPKEVRTNRQKININFSEISDHFLCKEKIIVIFKIGCSVTDSLANYSRLTCMSASASCLTVDFGTRLVKLR